MDPVQPTQSQISGLSRRNILLAAGGIIIVLALLLAGYFLLTSSALAFNGMRYLAGTFEERSLHEFTWKGTKEVTLPIAGKLIDYAREGKAEAAIVATESDAQEVVVIDGKETRTVVSGEGTRAGVAISRDAMYVAYAERTATEDAANPKDFFAPASWQIHVASVETGDLQIMGNGYAPHFFVRDGATYLAYMTESALHIANLSTNTHQDLPVGIKNASGAFPVLVSDDGAFVAVPTPAGAYTLLALQAVEGGAFVLSAVGNLPADARTVAFEGSSIYSIGRSSEELFFYRSSVGDASQPTAFERMPFTLVTKLIP